MAEMRRRSNGNSRSCWRCDTEWSVLHTRVSTVYIGCKTRRWVNGITWCGPIQPHKVKLRILFENTPDLKWTHPMNIICIHICIHVYIYIHMYIHIGDSFQKKLDRADNIYKLFCFENFGAIKCHFQHMINLNYICCLLFKSSL